MIGIEFEYTNKYNNIIKLIFDNIDINKYNWDISELQAYTENKIDLSSIKDIGRLIREKQKYSIVFANIKVFNKEMESCKIDTYDDFVKNKCELILLITDVNEFEIYMKDNVLKEQIIKNIKKLNISFKEKTIQNDGRTKMQVL